MTESASTWRHRPPLRFPFFFFCFSFFPSLLCNHRYHCIRLKSGKGLLQLQICTLTWLKNWPFSSTVCVFGNRWINQVDALVFALRFIDDVSVGDTARPSSHVGSRCHVVLKESFSATYLHIPQDKTSKEKKNLKQMPLEQLQVDALMYSCLIRRKRKKKWSFWNPQVFIWRSALW